MRSLLLAPAIRNTIREQLRPRKQIGAGAPKAPKKVFLLCLSHAFLYETPEMGHQWQQCLCMRSPRWGGDGNCVLWRVHIDPERGCRHVNVVARVVPGLAVEQEYLFAPYSAFTVLSASWKAGTSDDPHVIDMLAAVDNKEAPEDLPLAPWS